MNSQGAPEARSQMMSVWTGHEFIVWGGRGDRGAADYDRPFNDGARYHPDTDSWTPLSECPLNGRYDAISVWTGRELIVWGGAVRVPPAFLAAVPNLLTYGDGARYDPALDQWTLLPQEGALSARYKHTAVWTGTEIIIWGGAQYPSAVNFNDGARFNPATGRWTPLAQPGAPSDRSCHLAVWDGAEMIVWGGATIGGECFNTGGRYDPVLDRWTPLTLNNAPVPRYMQRPDAGVWTGRQLLVFGGYDYNIEFGVSAGWSPAPAMHLYQRSR